MESAHCHRALQISNMANQRGNGFIKFTLNYITETWLGKLKCAELVFSLLAGACVAGVGTSGNTCNCGSKVGFYNAIAWTAFVDALIDMITHLFVLWERLSWWFRHPARYLVVCALTVVGFLIGASLTASCAKPKCVSNPGAAGAAAFSGFVCFALFTVDCFLHFKKYSSIQEEARHQDADVEEPLPAHSESPGVV